MMTNERRSRKPARRAATGEERRVLKLLHVAGRARNEASGADEAIERSLRAICEASACSLCVAHRRAAGGDSWRTIAGVRCGSSRIVRSICETDGWVAGRLSRTQRVIDEGRVVVDKDGIPGLPTWIGVPIHTGDEVIGVIELFGSDDVTPSEDMREALEDIGALLGRTVERLELEQQTESASAAKRSFIARTAHELRSPLAAAGVALSTLARRGDRLDPEMRDELFSSADRSLEQLRQLVSRFGELAEMDGGDTDRHVTPIGLLPFVTDLLDDLMLALRQQVTVDVPDGLSVLADDVSLREIVANLVTNAAHHGGPNVMVSARSSDDGFVHLVVEDDGAGVPPAIADGLFEPFVRGGDGSDGFGLGLAISRRLARSIGGDLTHRSVEPHGAAFVVSLREAP